MAVTRGVFLRYTPPFKAASKVSDKSLLSDARRCLARHSSHENFDFVCSEHLSIMIIIHYTKVWLNALIHNLVNHRYNSREEYQYKIRAITDYPVMSPFFSSIIATAWQYYRAFSTQTWAIYSFTCDNKSCMNKYYILKVQSRRALASTKVLFSETL